MSTLIISNNSNHITFGQILSLRRDIESQTETKVDLLTFSTDKITFNESQVNRQVNPETIFSALKDTIEGKKYDLCVVSLALKYLQLRESHGLDIPNFINEISPETKVYIYGALSVLRVGASARSTTVYGRRGVAKLSRKFRDEIMRYILNMVAAETSSKRGRVGESSEPTPS